MFLALLVTAWAIEVAEVPNPRATNTWVSDLAGVLDDSAEAGLDQTLTALHKDLDVEVAVVTVQDVPGTPKQFATSLFNHWHIGDAESDSGLLVLLVMGQRRLEMETGYGLEGTLPDGWLGLMQTQQMVPHFKDGDFGAGLVAGIAAVDARLRATPEPVATGGPDTTDLQAARSESDYLERRRERDRQQALTYGLGGGAGGLLLVGGFGWRHRRRWHCHSCKTKLVQLSEAEEDAHLDPGQEKEEDLGSRDWHARECPSCGRMHLVSRSGWFSGHKKCRKCGYRTATRESTTTLSATYSHSGSRRVTETCAHCNHRRTWTETIPQLQDTSSSSSGGGWSGGGGSSGGGGGGGFGGGSSGGGGAGSSW